MKQRKLGLVFGLAAVLLLAAALLSGSSGRTESVQGAMRDAVLHDVNQISLFGLKTVTPGMISALTVTAALLIAAACLRVFVIPKFRYTPGRLQLLLEEAVGLFDNMARSNSPHRNRFLGLYLFSVGTYIFIGTLFELLGLQVVTVAGHPMLVTELVYYYVSLSFVLPVVVGVLFTLLHALVQTYVLTMLTALYYGEVSEPSHKEPKKLQAKKA